MGEEALPRETRTRGLAGRAWAETLKQLQEQLTDLGPALQDMLEMITNMHERVAYLESSLAKS